MLAPTLSLFLTEGKRQRCRNGITFPFRHLLSTQSCKCCQVRAQELRRWPILNSFSSCYLSVSSVYLTGQVGLAPRSELKHHCYFLLLMLKKQIRVSESERGRAPVRCYRSLGFQRHGGPGPARGLRGKLRGSCCSRHPPSPASQVPPGAPRRAANPWSRSLSLGSRPRGQRLLGLQLLPLTFVRDEKLFQTFLCTSV